MQQPLDIISEFFHNGFQVATKEQVFLFDVLKLGKDCFDQGLGKILEHENIMKVNLFAHYFVQTFDGLTRDKYHKQI